MSHTNAEALRKAMHRYRDANEKWEQAHRTQSIALRISLAVNLAALLCAMMMLVHHA